MRRLLSVILLICFLCQAFVVAGKAAIFDHQGAFEVSHAEMHLEGTVHHHDDDGATHHDDSPESIQHMLAEAGLGAAAPFCCALRLPYFGRVPAPAVTVQAFAAAPYLDGLRRPPRRIS